MLNRSGTVVLAANLRIAEINVKINQTYSQSLGMNQGDALIKQLKDKGYTLLVQ